MDREKVIKAFDDAKELVWRDDDEYTVGYNNGIEAGKNITLSMLKEQETKWIHREDLDFKDKLGCNHFHGMCGNCGFIHDFIDDHTGQYKYCPQCGQAVKWE